MDKSQLSSTLRDIDSRNWRKQEFPVSQRASPPVRLLNPNVSIHSSTREQMGSNPGENLARTREGFGGGAGSVPRGRGYNRNRHVRQMTDAFEQSKSNRRNPQERLSTYNDSSPFLGGKMGNNSLESSKRVLSRTRSDSNNARSKSPLTAPFEVKMSDFPELAVLPGKPLSPVHQRACWGPSPSPSNHTQRALSIHEKLPAKKPQIERNCHQSAPNAKSTSPHSADESPGAALEASSCSGAVTSWANVASQPPKVLVPKEKTISSTRAQEELLAQDDERLSGKKKRKKKKKKAKSDDEEFDAEEPAIFQEPPKFEDEEEFPGLTPAPQARDRFPASNNTAKPRSEESQREIQHFGDQSNEKSPATETVPTDLTKKGQKAEKVSGKKSKAPVQLDIGNMLAVLEKKQQSQKSKMDAKPVVLTVGGGRPVGPKPQPTQKKPPWQQDRIAHNPLDSTCPLVKKGKQREVPKAKKPTPLKRVILKEREERKHRRFLLERGLLPEQESQPNHDSKQEEECDDTATDGIPTSTDGVEEQPENHPNELESEETVETAQEDDTEERQTPATVPVIPTPPNIHSRKFREYCSQMLSKDVDQCVTDLLKELVRFQDRLYQKDPMKARMKKRIVMGLREVLKHLKLRKVKCVVISPNCERIQAKGGLDEALHTIIDTCREQGVPFVFALSRKALGRCVNKAVPVSLVGIFNYDGAQDHYHKMIELSSEARKAYEVMVLSVEQAESEPKEEGDVQELPLSNLSLTAEPEAGPNSQPEEPQFLKIWKSVLEKQINHSVAKSGERLVNMAGDFTGQSDAEAES